MGGWRFWTILFGALALAYGAAHLWLSASLARDRAAFHAEAIGYLTRWRAIDDLDPRALTDPQAGRLVFMGVRHSLFLKAHAALVLPTKKPNVTRIVILDRGREPQTYYTEIIQD